MIPVEIARRQYRYFSAHTNSWPIEETFRFAGCFYGGVACVTDRISGKERLIDTSGVTLHEFTEFLSCSGFVDADNRAGRYSVLSDDLRSKFCILDRDLKLKPLPSANAVSNVYSLGNFVVVQFASGELEVLNWEHNKLINPVAIFGLRANRLGNWTVATSKSLDQWRYLDVNAGVLLGPVYDNAYPFENGLSIASHAMKWHIIDSAFRNLVTLEMDSLEPFSNGFAVGVTLEDEIGLLDRTGDFLPLSAYSTIEAVKRTGLTIANRDAMNWSIDIIRTNGEILASGMDTASFLDNDFPFFVATRNDRELYLDSDARPIELATI